MGRCDVLVSIIMSAYKVDETCFIQSLESLLNQSYRNIEIIIIDDGIQNENVEQYLKTLKDTRVRVIKNEVNKGLPYSLNRGISMSNGKYIARMDTDDIATYKRIKKQVSYMENHPNVTLLGTRALVFGNNNSLRLSLHSNNEAIKANFLFSVGITHPSVMIRKEFLVKNELFYNERFRKSQDYELWTRIAETGGVFSEIPYIGIKYRTSDTQASAASNNYDQVSNAMMVKNSLLSKLGITMNERETQIHDFLSYGADKYAKTISCDELVRWAQYLVKANGLKEIYDESALSLVIADHIADCIKVYRRNGVKFKTSIGTKNLNIRYAILLSAVKDLIKAISVVRGKMGLI